MRLLITGTPCVGKTTLAVGVSNLLDCPLLRVNDLVEQLGCFKLDKKDGAKIVNIEILQKHLKKLLAAVARKNENVVVEGHLLCDVRLPCEKTVVLRCDPRVLERRMKKRRWKKEKVSENLLAEILDYCLVNSEQNYGAKRVVQIDFSKPLPAGKALKKIFSGKSDSVDWSGALLGENRFS